MNATLAAPNLNGHKKATKTPHANEHPAATGRKRKEDAAHAKLRTEATSPAAAGAFAKGDASPSSDDSVPRSAGVLERVWSDPIIRLPLAHLVRHPDNRRPAEADIAERAESIRARGILEPIIVRPIEDAEGEAYQVLSGETRWLATAKVGLTSIPARVVECSDAQALELLAEFNAQRKDLNVIEKARLIDRLCQTPLEGGAGLTREQAARIYGLESGSAASNLVRLLELPQKWQDRVASGELPYTWAREILPVKDLPPVMEALDCEWAQRDDDPFGENAFRSRKALNAALYDNILPDVCRRLDEDHWLRGTGARGKLALDKLTDEARERLGIVELQLPSDKPGAKGKLETVQVATEAKIFDELLANQLQQKTKAKAAAVGQDEPPAKKPPTAAELKRKAAERAEQLQEHIDAWRHKLLRREIGLAIDAGRDNGLRIVLAFACCPPNRGPGFSMCLTHNSPLYHLHTWHEVQSFRPSQQDERLTRVALHMLSLETDDRRQPVFELEVIEGLAAELGTDVAAAWKRLQDAANYDVPGPRGAELLEEFYSLLRTDELKELAAELGVHLMPTLKTKDQIVQFLLSVPRGSNRRLPLPKSIKPLAVACGKGKKQRKGK